MVTQGDGQIVEGEVAVRDMAIVVLYAQFSEDCYGSEWVACTEDVAGEFEVYLSSLRASSERSIARLEYHEFEALPFSETRLIWQDSGRMNPLKPRLSPGSCSTVPAPKPPCAGWRLIATEWPRRRMGGLCFPCAFPHVRLTYVVKYRYGSRLTKGLSMGRQADVCTEVIDVFGDFLCSPLDESVTEVWTQEPEGMTFWLPGTLELADFPNETQRAAVRDARGSVDLMLANIASRGACCDESVVSELEAARDALDRATERLHGQQARANAGAGE